MGRLLPVLLLTLPVLELWLLVQVGARLGFWTTLAVLVATAVLGTALARAEGTRALGQLQAALAQGRAPERAMLSGLLVFAGGVLLVIPGFVSDAIGLVLLLPPTRALVARLLERRLRRAVERGGVRVQFGGAWGPGVPRRDPLDDDIIDVEAEEVARRAGELGPAPRPDDAPDAPPPHAKDRPKDD